MSNRRKIDRDRLRRVLARDMASPRVRQQPDRRPRACCGSRQGFPHFARCMRPTWASARQAADEIRAFLGDPVD